MKPDFICIGAQKAGTSWLYDRLSVLPEFSMPPIKEMHYFDRAKHYPTPNFLCETNAINRAKTPGHIKQHVAKIANGLKTRNFHRSLWWTRYAFCNVSDEWYSALYNSERGVTGDITPSYSILNEDDVIRMQKVAPNAKIIFLIRNPIDRAWSSFRHLQKLNSNRSDIRRHTGRLGDELDFEDIGAISKFIESPYQELRSDYIRTIDLYLKHFERGNILLGFFDAIKEEPRDLLIELVRFIGVEKDVRLEGLQKISNRSISAQIPSEVREMLEKKYTPMIEELASRYGGYAEMWRRALSKENAEQSDEATLLSPVAHP